MKSISLKKCMSVAAAALAVSASAHASVIYTFDTDVSGFTGPVIWTAGPSGWSGGAALQTQFTASGWNNLSVGKNFDWASGDQPAIQGMISSGGGHVTFDILFDGTSFTSGVSDWYQVYVAGNSDSGWTQFQLALSSGWHDQNDASLHTTHVDLPFSQLGWTSSTSWYQMYFGANSGTSPLHYYIDNLQIAAVPEPSTFALVGIGTLAFRFYRRRH